MVLKNMRIPEKPMILVASVLWVLHYLFPQAAQILLLIMFVPLSIFPGIAHGALDNHLLLNSMDSLQKKLGFYVVYVGMILIMFTLWHFNSSAGLMIFLFLSSWHFGQTDNLRYGIRAPYLNVFNGSLVLGFILTSHYIETSEYLSILDVPVRAIEDAIFEWLSLSMFIVLSIVLYRFASTRRREVFYFLLFLLLISQLPLIPAFGLYFLGIHSSSAWFDIKELTQSNHLYLIKRAAFFTLAAVTLIVLFIFWNSNQSLNHQYHLAWFFVALSALSTPHIVVMHLFYKQSEISS